MSDAVLEWHDYGADVSIQGGDLVADDGLATPVLVSLFTDARAPSFDVLPDEDSSLRGWWGDFDQDDNTGSLLWLISREKLLPEVAERAREYCVDALRWLTDEDIAESYDVDVQLIKPEYMQIKIRIHRGGAVRYDYLWDAIEDYATQRIQRTSIEIEFLP